MNLFLVIDSNRLYFKNIYLFIFTDSKKFFILKNKFNKILKED